MMVSFYTEITPQKDKQQSHILQCFVNLQNDNIKYRTTISTLLAVETDRRTQCGLCSFEPIFNFPFLCNITLTLNFFELYILFQPDLAEVKKYVYRKSVVKI